MKEFEVNGLKVLDAVWYTQMGGPVIGIVMCEEIATGNKKSYIGTGDGISAESDARSIAMYGAKFYGNPFVNYHE